MKVFIALPMGSMTANEFTAARNKAEADCRNKGATEICESYVEDFENDRKAHATKNLALLLSADAAYFADGWKKCQECKAEHVSAETFGIKILKD